MTKLLTTFLVTLMLFSMAWARSGASPFPFPRFRVGETFGHAIPLHRHFPSVLAKINTLVEPYEVAAVHRFSQSIFDQPQEKSGLLYSCRGGFLDIAHVRQAADLTAWFYHQIKQRVSQPSSEGLTITLPEEAARRQLELSRELLLLDPQNEHTEVLFIEIAAQATEQLGFWHEAWSWFDYRAVFLYNERHSAFSPEDLYSNALGIHLAMRALAQDSDRYEENMNTLMKEYMTLLQAQPSSHNQAAFEAIEGESSEAWWNKNLGITETTRVSKRYLQTEAEYKPWLVEFDSSPCSPFVEPYNVQLPRTLASAELIKTPFRYVLAFENDSTLPLWPKDFPREVDQSHISLVVNRIREQMRREIHPMVFHHSANVSSSVRTALLDR